MPVITGEFRYDNNGTFTLTTMCHASATFTFTGTKIWIFGAKRGNHGLYNITLDGTVYTNNGFSNEEEFQQVLFTTDSDLDGTKPHTVSITNWPTDAMKKYLDVDSVRTLIV